MITPTPAIIEVKQQAPQQEQEPASPVEPRDESEHEIDLYTDECSGDKCLGFIKASIGIHLLGAIWIL
jgi:hypothetical protein